MVDPQCRWTSPNDWTEWSQWLAAGLHAAQPVAFAFASDRDFVCPGPSYGDDLAACRWGQRRLPRLLLLPGRPRTQDRIGGNASCHSDSCENCLCPGGCCW